jgi:hypothetical protein
MPDFAVIWPNTAATTRGTAAAGGEAAATARRKISAFMKKTNPLATQ